MAYLAMAESIKTDNLAQTHRKVCAVFTLGLCKLLLHAGMFGAAGSSSPL